MHAAGMYLVTLLDAHAGLCVGQDVERGGARGVAKSVQSCMAWRGSTLAKVQRLAHLQPAHFQLSSVANTACGMQTQQGWHWKAVKVQPFAPWQQGTAVSCCIITTTACDARKASGTLMLFQVYIAEHIQQT